jgi:hypothetical protein
MTVMAATKDGKLRVAEIALLCTTGSASSVDGPVGQVFVLGLVSAHAQYSRR